LDQLGITNFCRFESQLCHHEQPRTSILGTISIHIAQITNELIPAIEHAYPVRQGREARSILGVSFGGLNAACFGLLGYETFSGIGMHSPANHPVKNLLPAYEQAPKLPLRIFLSTGSPNDNAAANRKFRRLLKEKGYDMKFIQKNAGHNWDNWRPLIDDVLLFFYGEL
jgi:enterochelin esterase-like enzyme